MYSLKSLLTARFHHLLQFNLYSDDIARTVTASILSVIEVSSSMSIAITSYANDRSQVFPQVSLPDFEIRAAKAEHLTNSDTMMWIPIVDGAERENWEQYTAQAGPKWLRSALDQSGREDEEIPEFSTRITDQKGNVAQGPVYTGDEALSGKYSVVW